MTATTIRVQMAQRKDTAANWTAANPILLSGEIGYETNTKKFKIGDGSTAWNSLAYLPIPDGSGNLTITGNLEIGSTGSLTFEGSTADGFETTLAVTNPTADRTITLPNQSGTVLVSGNASIVDADIAANAEIAVSKLADGAARQLLQTDAAGTGVEWTSNIDVPGTLDVTNTATFDSIAQYPAGSAAAPTITFTGDTNTGLFSPGSDQLALATGGTQRLLIDASGNVISAGNLYANGTNGVVLFSADPANYNISRSGGDLTFKGGANISVSAGGGTSSLLLSNSPYAAFNVGGSERLRLDSSGRLGLGTSTPQGKLIVSNGGANGIEFFPDTDSGANSTINSFNRSSSTFSALSINAAQHIFLTSSSERARIDSSGRLLVGTSSYTGNSKLAVAGGAGTDVALLDLRFGGSRPTTADSGVSEIRFGSPDQTSNNAYAKIECITDGASSSNTDIPARLVFSTTADGASSPTERMRIDSAGRFMVGTTSDGGANGLTIYPSGSGAGSAAIGVWNKTNTSSEGAAQFRVGGSTIGSITYSNTAVAYNTTSDYRLKENVTPLTGAADRLNQLQVHRFNFIADPGKTVDGFIAHEAQAVVPECVTGTKDEVDADGNPVYQGIDQSKLVPLLTAALQEALQKIEDLEGRLSAAGL